LTGIGAIAASRLSVSEHIDVGRHWPTALNAGGAWTAGAWLLFLIAVLFPMAAMIIALKRPLNPKEIWTEFSPQATGSLLIAIVSGIAAFVIALTSAMHRHRGLLAIASVSFLIGPLLLAIALIRIYNHRWLWWIYDSLPLIVMAYIARFGWLALVAGRSTWSRAFRQLRELASLDGANALRVARSIVWPIAWPILAAAGMLVMILSLTEVPATVLLSPQHPQPLIPMMMQWVHLQRNDSMIEAALLLCGMVLVLGIATVLLGCIGRRTIPAKSQ